MVEQVLKRRREIVGPLYLFGCLFLGGSAQGIWSNMILQLAGLLIIGWAAMVREGEPLTRAGQQLLILATACICLVALQMIPLPPALWSHLGPRGRIAGAFGILGMPVPPEPLSLTPASGLGSILGIIPPLAVICAMLRLRAYRPEWLALSLVAGTLVGTALGALQVGNFSGQPMSPWYLYQESNWGRAVGFFANADHMAALLVITIPFLAAIVASGKNAKIQGYSAIIAVVAGVALVLLVGLALNGSLAGYGLALPVAAASSLIILPDRSRLKLWALGAAIALVIAATLALETSSVGAGKLGEHAASATQSRAQLFSATSHAAADFMPFGSGLGSFRSVYPLYENPQQVTQIYAVHAHNDYLEVALELGAGGVLLTLLFLTWWSTGVWRAWKTPQSNQFARAAAISSAALLVHSLVDFPLRTAALSACFAVCVGLLADNRPLLRQQAELRRARHRTVGPV